MPALLSPTLSPSEPIRAPSRHGLDALSGEGRKVREAALDLYHSWQERAEVLLAQEGNGWPREGLSEQPHEGSWDSNNRRRLFLIHKQFHSPEGLSAAETEELRHLQAQFESYLDSTRPLPHQMLDDLEALAKRLETEDEQP